MPDTSQPQRGSSTTPNINEIIESIESAITERGIRMHAGRQGIEIADDGAVTITRVELKEASEAVRKDTQSLAEKGRV